MFQVLTQSSSESLIKKFKFLLIKQRWTDRLNTQFYLFLPLSAHRAHGCEIKNDKNTFNKNNKSHSFFLSWELKTSHLVHTLDWGRNFFTFIALSHYFTDSSTRSLLHEMRLNHTELNQQLKVHLKKLFCLPFFNRKTSCVKKWARAVMLPANIVEKVFFLPL